MIKGFSSPDGEKGTNFSLPSENYKWIMVGFGIVVIGFFLMMGGGSDDPNEFNEAIFSFRRITLAPWIVVIGFVSIFWAIMRKPKSKKQ